MFAIFQPSCVAVSPRSAALHSGSVPVVATEERVSRNAKTELDLKLASLNTKFEKKQLKIERKVKKADKFISKVSKKVGKKLNKDLNTPEAKADLYRTIIEAKGDFYTNFNKSMLAAAAGDPGKQLDKAGYFAKLVEKLTKEAVDENNSKRNSLFQELANRCEALVGPMTGFTAEQVAVLRKMADGNIVVEPEECDIYDTLAVNPNYIALRKELMMQAGIYMDAGFPVEPVDTVELCELIHGKMGIPEVTSEVSAVVLSEVNAETGESKELLRIDHTQDKPLPTQDLTGAVAKVAAEHPEVLTNAVANALVNVKRGDATNNRRARVQHVPSKPTK